MTSFRRVIEERKRSQHRSDLTEEERIASYSEEARKVGEQPSEDDQDVEDMDEGESDDDTEIASATPEGDEDGEKSKAPEDGGSKA